MAAFLWDNSCWPQTYSASIACVLNECIVVHSLCRLNDPTQGHYDKLAPSLSHMWYRGICVNAYIHHVSHAHVHHFSFAINDRHMEEYMSEKVSYIVTLEDWDANFDQVISQCQYIAVHESYSG